MSLKIRACFHRQSPTAVSFYSIIFVFLISASAMASGDPYEDDDDHTRAEWLPLWVNGSLFPDIPHFDWSQARNFHDHGDADWVQFFASTRYHSYVVSVESPGENCNAVVQIFREDDLVNPIEEFNYPFLGEPDPARFEPLYTGKYYAKIFNFDPEGFGPGADYILKLKIPAVTFPTLIYGVVTPAVRATISINNHAETMTLSNNSYLLPYFAGTFTLTATAPGYSDFSREITIEEIKPLELDIDLVPSIIRASDVIPDIKANGSDGPLVVSSSEKVLITVSLVPGDPGEQGSQEADWWIARQNFDPDPGFLFYTHPNQWDVRVVRAIKHDLVTLDNAALPSLNLPVGDYIFYFAVDDNADGQPDATWLDFVELHVRD